MAKATSLLFGFSLYNPTIFNIDVLYLYVTCIYCIYYILHLYNHTLFPSVSEQPWLLFPHTLPHLFLLKLSILSRIHSEINNRYFFSEPELRPLENPPGLARRV